MDKFAFDHFILSAYEDGYKVAFNILRHQGDSQDALHNAIEIAYKKSMQINDNLHVKQWFISIVYRESLQIIRRQRRIIPSKNILMEGNMHQETQVMNNLTVEYLLSFLKTNERTVILLKYHMGYTLKEIGIILNKPESSIKSTLYRSLKKMNEAYGQEVLEHEY